MKGAITFAGGALGKNARTNGSVIVVVNSVTPSKLRESSEMLRKANCVISPKAALMTVLLSGL